MEILFFFQKTVVKSARSFRTLRILHNKQFLHNKKEIGINCRGLDNSLISRELKNNFIIRKNYSHRPTKMIIEKQKVKEK